MPNQYSYANVLTEYQTRGLLDNRHHRYQRTRGPESRYASAIRSSATRRPTTDSRTSVPSNRHTGIEQSGPDEPNASSPTPLPRSAHHRSRTSTPRMESQEKNTAVSKKVHRLSQSSKSSGIPEQELRSPIAVKTVSRRGTLESYTTVPGPSVQKQDVRSLISSDFVWDHTRALPSRAPSQSIRSGRSEPSELTQVFRPSTPITVSRPGTMESYLSTSSPSDRARESPGQVNLRNVRDHSTMDSRSSASPDKMIRSGCSDTPEMTKAFPNSDSHGIFHKASVLSVLSSVSDIAPSVVTQILSPQRPNSDPESEFPMPLALNVLLDSMPAAQKATPNQDLPGSKKKFPLRLDSIQLPGSNESPHPSARSSVTVVNKPLHEILDLTERAEEDERAYLGSAEEESSGTEDLDDPVSRRSSVCFSLQDNTIRPWDNPNKVHLADGYQVDRSRPTSVREGRRSISGMCISHILTRDNVQGNENEGYPDDDEIKGLSTDDAAPPPIPRYRSADRSEMPHLMSKSKSERKGLSKILDLRRLKPTLSPSQRQKLYALQNVGSTDLPFYPVHHNGETGKPPQTWESGEKKCEIELKPWIDNTGAVEIGVRRESGNQRVTTDFRIDTGRMAEEVNGRRNGWDSISRKFRPILSKKDIPALDLVVEEGHNALDERPERKQKIVNKVWVTDVRSRGV